MAKTITFSYKGTEYTLEFTRWTVEQMERGGFNISELGDKPMTVLPQLFAGSFLAHHKYMKRETIEDIYAHMTNRNELIGKLAEMYNEPMSALIDEPEEDDLNMDWTANW